MVKAGQALAQLDTERLALELARTETNLESLRRPSSALSSCMRAK